MTVGQGAFSGRKIRCEAVCSSGSVTQALSQVEEFLARTHDAPMAPKLKAPQTVTVQDRAYVDVKRMEKMDQSGVHFVVRLRRNLTVSSWKSLPEDSPVLRDGTCYLGESRQRFRMVSFRDDKRWEFHVTTNLRGVSAETIAELCRERWQVELFFRWMKQHLNVKHLFRTTMNAVYGQLFCTCIAYHVLLRRLYSQEKPVRFEKVSILDFMRNLWSVQLPAEWVLSLFDHLQRPKLYTIFG
ncbi:IS4 family transposase [Paludifilum halophilum]|nr:IS4 family transposase [Paludifilum halophilum]